MRGGIFDDGYQIEKWDFVKYIEIANKKVFKKKEALLENLPELFTLSHLKELAEKMQTKTLKDLPLNICLLNLVEGMVIQVDPGTGFQLIQQVNWMVQKYWTMKETGEIFFKTGKPWLIPILSLSKV